MYILNEVSKIIDFKMGDIYDEENRKKNLEGIQRNYGIYP